MKQKSEFWKTIQEVNNMTQEHMNQKEKQHFKQNSQNLKKKGQKMPINMLKGIRNSIKEKYEKQKNQQQNENIQYDSTHKYRDLNFLNQKKQKNPSYMKNSYKYSEMKSGKQNQFKNGILKISQHQIKKINK